MLSRVASSDCHEGRSPKSGRPSTSDWHPWLSLDRPGKQLISSCQANAMLTDRRLYSKIAADDEYVLYCVVIFRRVHDEFAQKCRDNRQARGFVSRYRSSPIVRFILRDFSFDAEALAKHQEDLKMADVSERELWVRNSQRQRGAFLTPFLLPE